MITSKSNNHDHPKMIWPTSTGSMSHHTLSVYVANWMKIWSLLNIYGYSVDPCHLVGIWMLHRFHPNVVINFNATTLMQMPLSLYSSYSQFFCMFWNMTVLLQSLTYSSYT